MLGIQAHVRKSKYYVMGRQLWDVFSVLGGPSLIMVDHDHVYCTLTFSHLLPSLVCRSCSALADNNLGPGEAADDVCQCSTESYDDALGLCGEAASALSQTLPQKILGLYSHVDSGILHCRNVPCDQLVRK